MSGTVDKSGGAQSDSYGRFVTGDGDVVVYDRDNPEAWIQSDYTVRIGRS